MFHRGFSEARFLAKAAKFAPGQVEAYLHLMTHLQQTAPRVTPKTLGLKVIVIADTHGYLAFAPERLDGFLDGHRDFELCFVLGDVYPAELALIADRIGTDRILAVKGNHDDFSQYEKCGIREISGRVIQHRGIRIGGIEGSFRYKGGNYPSFTQYESLQLAMEMPPADILITHDRLLEDLQHHPAHIGLAGNSYYVYRNAVQWHLHGHIHQSLRRTLSNGTKQAGVYLCEYLEL